MGKQSRRKQRLTWGARSMPALARAQAHGYRQFYRAAKQNPRVFLESAVRAAGTDRDQLEAVFHSIEELPHLADVLSTIPLYWVTAPMTETAIVASHKVPEVHLDRDAPSPSGLMAFAEPLPPLPSGDPIPVSAIMWRGDGDKMAITTLSWRGHRPDEEERAPGFGDKLEHIITARVPRDRIADLESYIDEEDGRSLLSFLSSAWVLMMTPTVADRKSLYLDQGGGRHPQGEPPAQPVTLINLRPLRHTDFSETDPETGQVYTHRFPVRGHRRNQAYGHGYSEHRLTWIPGYIKGPEGAPLKASDKVMVWRR